jgi:hypothetical protein
MELLQTLREAYCGRVGAAQRLPTPWVPETFIVDRQAECDEVLAIQQSHDDSKAQDQEIEKKPDLLWIYKPSCMNRGRGVRVIKGMDSLKEIVCTSHSFLFILISKHLQKLP